MFQFIGTPGCEEPRLCKGALGASGRRNQHYYSGTKETLIG